MIAAIAGVLLSLTDDKRRLVPLGIVFLAASYIILIIHSIDILRNDPSSSSDNSTTTYLPYDSNSSDIWTTTTIRTK